MIFNKKFYNIFIIFFAILLYSCNLNQSKLSGKWNAKKVFISRISTFSEVEMHILYQESFIIKNGKIYYNYKDKSIECALKKVKDKYYLSKILDYNSLQIAKKEFKGLSENTVFSTHSFDCGKYYFFGNFLNFSEDYKFAIIGRDGATILFLRE